MAITRDHIRETLTAYVDTRPGEKEFLAPVLELLGTDAELTSRKEFRGHATAGAVLVDDDAQVLLIHHNALGTWLTPGGHLEPEDSTLLDAALRELAEETGISAGVTPLLTLPVHIDVHAIPANPAKNEPAHQHFDFRYLFRLAGDRDITLQAEEVNGFAWRPLDDLGDATLRRHVHEALR
ncbi:NUDIX hydrolase [Streptomyces acidiscabies]|uniref:NUDIX hydrolase n=2 Tax=Streptomyces acidiscabies TaxID=42234 RepID=A0ABU4LKS5_9ACTN|nr:NUDIX hydrolase [Streptomyces acidiscabies]MBP5938293.1 NUDIX hydrolase [Streptomyces sp. LBUM 1476]MBZ3909319.1 NUDIX hydrolase [Streptomyces acidiscabies]MDX3016273.1 NUDIX hydrolase [Streptomyces acidiscabies]MDX3796870.1 NUDIX hydrolase [Streptomyces acidiscabies]GAQ55231.1 putative DHNTP pyrophosphohydrolase [Streptomyces acidiscabies]